jgi:hypothetical protein
MYSPAGSCISFQWGRIFITNAGISKAPEFQLETPAVILRVPGGDECEARS